MERHLKLADFRLMSVMAIIFAALAIGMWRATGVIFYLYNFAIIGCSLALGMGLWPLLPKRNRHWARRLSQILVGGYMFFGLGMGLIYVGNGVIVPENMQLEGFWLWLLSGMAAASVIHYLIAKIAGPLIFNRGWCGWACWTVALLDLLPWKRSAGRIDGKWEYLRYVHFALSLMIGLVLVNGFHYTTADTLGVVLMKQVTAMNRAVHGSIWTIPELWWFLGGNMVYFAVGVALAVRLKDNRAFCKYFCPIVPFFKVSSRPALIKIRADSSKCTGCGICERNCPMDISLTQYIRAGKRITSSECIICKTCTSVCPEGALELTYGRDVSIKDNLTRRKQGWRT